jgi:hypothetical protein
MSQRMNPFNEKTSYRRGILGFFESTLRKAKGISFLIFFGIMAGIGLFCIGLALGVSTLVYSELAPGFSHNIVLRSFETGLTLSLCFFCYGVSLIFIAPALNFMLRLNKLIKPGRGSAYSLETMPWYLHNALIYIVRYSFIEFLTPSPLNVLFYKMMGMKIGKGVIINTSNISDACLIELGDYVTLGGSAHLLAHYSKGGYLILSQVNIGKNSTIGLKATVMGDVLIGENCLVKPHSLVLPGARIEDGSAV